MKHHIAEDGRGPASAQKHLRDLAHSIPSATSSRKGEGQHPPTLEVSGEEGGLLEFQDVTDYGNRYAEVANLVHSLQTNLRLKTNFIYVLNMTFSIDMRVTEMNRLRLLQSIHTMKNS